jgi:MazG family protein
LKDNETAVSKMSPNFPIFTARKNIHNMSRNEMSSREAKLEAFGRLLDIMDELREKCPWDHKQTTESLRPQTIEETYELSDAILRGEGREVSKELGDVLLHIVFYAKIASEKGEYDIVDVINRLCDKLIYRHPHVFGEVHVDGADQVVQNWEELKTKEKDGNKRVLSGVPVSLPPLLKAYRMQDKARAVGFDWEERSQVWDKVAEELGEFREELGRMDKSDPESVKRAEGELGDFLFSIVNAARLYDLNPDTALEMTCAKFRRRFTYLEEHTIRQGKSLKDMTLAEMDAIWDEAKALEKNSEDNAGK